MTEKLRLGRALTQNIMTTIRVSNSFGLFGLICVQNVCKIYRQTAKFDTSGEIIKHFELAG